MIPDSCDVCKHGKICVYAKDFEDYFYNLEKTSDGVIQPGQYRKYFRLLSELCRLYERIE